MLAIYISTMSLFIAVDTIVWANNFSIISPVWCDISESCFSLLGDSKLFLGYYIVTHVGIAALVGMPACTLVITRRLCKIIQRRTFVDSKRSVRTSTRL